MADEGSEYGEGVDNVWLLHGGFFEEDGWVGEAEANGTRDWGHAFVVVVVVVVAVTVGWALGMGCDCDLLGLEGGLLGGLGESAGGCAAKMCE